MSQITSGNDSSIGHANGRGKQLALIAIVALPMAAILYLGWQHAHPSFDRYTAALEAMRSHHVTVDAGGRVDFSKQFPGLVPPDDLGNQNALITWLDDGSFRAVFPTYRGKSSELAGLMYTSRPLQDDDTNARVSSTDFDQRTIKVGPLGALILEQKLNDHWYKVSNKLH